MEPVREDDGDKMEEKLQEGRGRSRCRTSRSHVTSPEMAFLLAVRSATVVEVLTRSASLLTKKNSFSRFLKCF